MLKFTLMDDVQPNLDPAAALSQVTDDTPASTEAARWAEEQLLEGSMPDDLLAQMVANGWEANDAEIIVENARKETRGQRGVLTRDDVVRDLNVDYRRATGGLSVAFRSGLFGLYGFTTGFMAALRSARKLKAIIRSRK